MTKLKIKNINKTEYVFVRVTKDQMDKLKSLAGKEECKVTEIIRRIIKDKFK